MICLFDSSSIFSAIQLDLTDKIVGGYTATLARYELGNVILKEGVIYKRISTSEQEELIRVVEHLFKLMRVLDIGNSYSDVLKTALTAKLSFYDAVYLHLAKTIGIPLVTEDNKLKECSRKYIRTMTLKEV